MTTTQNHWLIFNLVGHKSNRDGIGAEIKVTTSHGTQWLTVSTSGSYLSSNDKRAHFGLGTDTTAKTVEIHWPSGIIQRMSQIHGDQVLRVEASARGKARPAEPVDRPVPRDQFRRLAVSDYSIGLDSLPHAAPLPTRLRFYQCSSLCIRAATTDLLGASVYAGTGCTILFDVKTKRRRGRVRVGGMSL